MHNKKVNVNISAIFHPCLDSHISITVCVCLHCTRTTEEVAFGIMMCTHVLQSCSPKQGDKKTKQIQRINAGNIKKDNAEDWWWEWEEICGQFKYETASLQIWDLRKKNHTKLYYWIKLCNQWMNVFKKYSPEWKCVWFWEVFLSLFDKAFKWNLLQRDALQIDGNLKEKEARLQLGNCKETDYGDRAVWVECSRLSC